MLKEISEEIRGLYADSDEAYAESEKLRAGAKFQTGTDKEQTLARAVELENLAIKWSGDAMELELAFGENV